MLTKNQQYLKRSFDVFFSLIALITLFPIILLLIVFASISTNSFGLFFQKRVGQDGRLFTIFKIKSMMKASSPSSVGVVTKFGFYIRSSKLDELPQLFNILIGDMSFVGPRPDVQGYADKLVGDDRIILSVKPGLTGPASIKYTDEELLLSSKKNAKNFNDTVIWPDKVSINKTYIKNWSFMGDVEYLFKTFIK